MQCKFWFVSRVDGIKKGGGGDCMRGERERGVRG